MYPGFDTQFYLLLGVLLLFGGLIALAKLGLWFWFLSQFRPRYEDDYRRPPRPRESSASKVKTWLGIVATTLGILSTTVGLVKECSPEAKKAEPGGRIIGPSQDWDDEGDVGDVDHVDLPYSSVCCSQIGNCMMLTGSLPVGSQCTCFDILGNVAIGRVCR